MTVIHDIKKYIPAKEDTYFFDTNIWMYLYCPLGNYNEKSVEIYNEFFEKVINAESRIYTSAIQISEFINAYSKLEFKFAKKADKSIKDYKGQFRNTPDFLIILEKINNIVNKRIVSRAIQINDSFEICSLNSFLHNLYPYDFNDEYYSMLSEIHNFKIVTNDQDFKKLDKNIEIVTII